MSVNVASDLLNFGAELDDAIDQLHGLLALVAGRGVNATRAVLQSQPAGSRK
jgi:hypothetical protein